MGTRSSQHELDPPGADAGTSNEDRAAKIGLHSQLLVCGSAGATKAERRLEESPVAMERTVIAGCAAASRGAPRRRGIGRRRRAQPRRRTRDVGQRRN